MSTTKELLQTLNTLRIENGKTELASWKAGRDKLDAAIVAEEEARANRLADEGEGINPEDLPQDETQVDETETQTDETSEGEETETETPVVEEKAPRGAIGALVIELLVTDMPYADIVETVKAKYPMAKTTARSIASVAMDLRRDGIEVPSRRKPAAPKPVKAPKPAAKTE